MALGKGEQSKAVEIAAPVATLVSASNEWSDPGADISLCQEQLLHVGGHQPVTRGATVGCDHCPLGTSDVMMRDIYFADENR